MSKDEYETTVLANASEHWPEDLAADDKIAVIVVKEDDNILDTSKPAIKKMTWNQHYDLEQETYLDCDNPVDQKRVFVTDAYEMRVHKRFANDDNHFFSGKDDDCIVVDGKNGAQDAFLLYNGTLINAIDYMEDYRED